MVEFSVVGKQINRMGRRMVVGLLAVALVCFSLPSSAWGGMGASCCVREATTIDVSASIEQPAAHRGWMAYRAHCCELHHDRASCRAATVQRDRHGIAVTSMRTHCHCPRVPTGGNPMIALVMRSDAGGRGGSAPVRMAAIPASPWIRSKRTRIGAVPAPLSALVRCIIFARLTL